MRKCLSDLFSALVLAVLACWVLFFPIAPAGETAPIPVAPVCIELPAPEPEPSEEISMCTYNPAIPLSAELQAVLYEACEENDVPVALALGVIEVESCFLADADNGQCYGLMQLNRKYFPDKLSRRAICGPGSNTWAACWGSTATQQRPSRHTTPDMILADGRMQTPSWPLRNGGRLKIDPA